MGKKTRTVSKERLETIKQHVEWATQQVPLVAALSQFADGCAVYAPSPTERSTGEFDHTWHIQRVFLVPDDYCEEAVTIPANSSRLALMSDKGKEVLIGADPLAGTPLERYVEIGADLEVILPGGGTARMTKTDEGYTVKEEADDEAS